MMLRGICCLAAAMALAACPSAAEPPASPCADISGNYQGTATRLSGTCDPKLDGDGKGSFTLAKGGDGNLSITIPSIPGACPGTFDAAACRFQATCEGKGADGVTVVATFAVDYTFSGSSYKGSSVAGLRPPSVATACTASYQETGSKL